MVRRAVPQERHPAGMPWATREPLSNTLRREEELRRRYERRAEIDRRRAPPTQPPLAITAMEVEELDWDEL